MRHRRLGRAHRRRPLIAAAQRLRERLSRSDPQLRVELTIRNNELMAMWYDFEDGVYVRVPDVHNRPAARRAPVPRTGSV